MAAAVAEKQLKQTPHGGELVDLTLRKEDWEKAIDSCNTATELSDRGACDVELLANGCFTCLIQIGSGFANFRKGRVDAVCSADLPYGKSYCDEHIALS